MVQTRLELEQIQLMPVVLRVEPLTHYMHDEPAMKAFVRLHMHVLFVVQAIPDPLHRQPVCAELTVEPLAQAMHTVPT